VGQDGEVFSMGLNNYGQLGTGDNLERLTAELIDPSYWKGAVPIDATAGEHHSLVLASSGTAFAFGRGDSGQLGLNIHSISTPMPIPFPGKITQIATGGNHNLALTSAQEVYSWGYGGMHQLGHGPDNDESVPKKIGLVGRVIQVAAGGQHSVVLVQK
jgi:alpha-tubulin suppressor-like RCC1 family protein